MSYRTPKPSFTGAVDDAATSLGLLFFPAQCAICHMPVGMRARHKLCQACFDMLEHNLGPRCHICDVPLAAASGHGGHDAPCDGDTCQRCIATPPPFVTLRAPYLYGGGLAEVVVASKFRHREDLAQALGQLLLMDPRASELTREAQALVPIPLGPKRRRQRGYNLSTIMARVLSRAWRVPVRHALYRVHETKPQSQLTLAQRRENMQQAFAPRLPLSGPALLVDDVVTSAETARDAARAVIAAGASSVAVLAVARATLDPDG